MMDYPASSNSCWLLSCVIHKIFRMNHGLLAVELIDLLCCQFLWHIFHFLPFFVILLFTLFLVFFHLYLCCFSFFVSYLYQMFEFWIFCFRIKTKIQTNLTISHFTSWTKYQNDAKTWIDPEIRIKKTLATVEWW